MLISGINQCEHCGSDIKWEYFITRHVKHNTITEPVRLNKKASRMYILNQINEDEEKEGYKYLCEARCKQCYCYTEFTYESNVLL